MSKAKELVILCGGKGTRLGEETKKKPKPLLEIGGGAMLFHHISSSSFSVKKQVRMMKSYKNFSVIDLMDEVKGPTLNGLCQLLK